MEQLVEYRHSSYWYLSRPRQRPGFLHPETALLESGLPDTPAGRKSYQDHLAWQLASGPAGKSRAYVNMSCGWALGGGDYKKALVKDHALAADRRAWECTGASEIREAQWQDALHGCLRVLRKTPDDAHRDRKAAPWKVAAAVHLKQVSQVSNRWLAGQLVMGSSAAVSQYVSRFRREGGDATEWLRRLK